MWLLLLNERETIAGRCVRVVGLYHNMQAKLILLSLFLITSLFKDVAEQSGLRFQHYNGMTGKFYLPERSRVVARRFSILITMATWMSIWCRATCSSQILNRTTLFPWRGPEPPRGKLFRNDLKAGDSKLSFTDVTQKSGILATGYGMGAATGDINNDGLPDLYLTNLGANQMYLNKGGGKFVDVTKVE